MHLAPCRLVFRDVLLGVSAGRAVAGPAPSNAAVPSPSYWARNRVATGAHSLSRGGEGPALGKQQHWSMSRHPARVDHDRCSTPLGRPFPRPSHHRSPPPELSGPTSPPAMSPPPELSGPPAPTDFVP